MRILTDLRTRFLLLLGILNSKKAFCAPLNVNINILSNICNSQCMMCHHYSKLINDSRREPEILPLKFLKKFLFALEEMSVKCVTFCADGEPFLHPNITEILLSLKSLNLKYHFLTNGFSIREECMSFFDERATIRISIHSSNAKTWSEITGLQADVFYELIRKVKDIKATGARVAFHFVVCKNNYHQLLDLVELARHCNVDEVSIGPLTVAREELGVMRLSEDEFRKFQESIPKAKRMAEKYDIENNLSYFTGIEFDAAESFSTVKLYTRIPCYVGWLFTWIDVHGNVRFCCNHTGSLGNIMDKSLEAIWYSSEYNRQRYLAKRHRGNLVNCSCYRCANYMVNMKVHNILHFWRRTIRAN